LEDRLNIGKH